MKRILFTFLLIFLALFSCGSSDEDTEFQSPNHIEDSVPSNLQLTINVFGLDADNPNGDGSGRIDCIATATDAITYNFKVTNYSDVENVEGKAKFTFIDKGTNNFIIEVTATSKDNKSISISKGIQVFVNDEMELVWSDDFDVDGAPNAEKWGYNIGTGSGGWGNNESQYYTDRSENVEVKDGVLKITAKKEDYSGASYTSTRLLTQDKFEFTYGKVEVKARLPIEKGTWPAIWMLGANISDSNIGWPACGEIDIMEHVGNNQGTVSSAMHTPSSYGNTINKGEKHIASVSSDFHVYSVDWMPKKIVFAVDGVDFYTYSPGNKNMENWPFSRDQFIILNVAMGGSFGGTIDSNFSESSMEIDYVKVYQK